MSDDIDPDRKFSNGTDWDNSIDWDDASDGSDGGYDRHGSPINANAMKELVQLRMETSRLRAELAAEREQKFRHMDNSTKLCKEIIAIRADNERLREALGYYAEENYNGYNGSNACARAAIEGVTEKEGAEND